MSLARAAGQKSDGGLACRGHAQGLRDRSRCREGFRGVLQDHGQRPQIGFRSRWRVRLRDRQGRLNRTLSREGFWLLLTLAFFWGVNWPAMKFSVLELPPWVFRVLCVYIGAAGLFAIAGRLRLDCRIPAGADRAIGARRIFERDHLARLHRLWLALCRSGPGGADRLHHADVGVVVRRVVPGRDFRPAARGGAGVRRGGADAAGLARFRRAHRPADRLGIDAGGGDRLGGGHRLYQAHEFPDAGGDADRVAIGVRRVAADRGADLVRSAREAMAGGRVDAARLARLRLRRHRADDLLPLGVVPGAGDHAPRRSRRWGCWPCRSSAWRRRRG